MTLTFLSHQWKSFWRSKNTGKSIVVKAVMGLLVLYLIVNLLFIAYFLDLILSKVFPGRNVLEVFNSFLLYNFLLDIWMRYQLQELPTLIVQPYLALPVRRNKIVNYLCLNSLFSAFTIIPFILTLPFLIKVILPAYGLGAFSGFIGAILGITVFNHFFTLWLKRKESLNGWFMLLILSLIAGVALADFYWHIISISKYSTWVFDQVLQRPLYCVIFLIVGAIMYVINYRYLKRNLYLDELRTNTVDKKSATDYPFFNRFGKAGDLAANELKLILRNKRTKSTVQKCALFLFYGLIFYTNPKLNNSAMATLFCPMFITGIFIITYGQFMFGWQSAHFDGILAGKISIKDFFKSKFLLFTVFSTVAFVLSIPYVYFGWRILIMHFIMYVWNLGVNTVLVLFFANMNYKRIDLSKGASFNWEGVGATQWILSIPLLISPFIVYLPFKWLGHGDIGLAIVTIVGIAFILTREFWLDILVKNFNENRYTIAEGFRND